MTTAPPTRRSATLAAIVGSLLLVLATGCGVPLDESPRAISRSTTPPEATPTTSGSPSAATVNVDVTRRLKVQGEVGADGRTSVGVSAEWEY